MKPYLERQRQPLEIEEESRREPAVQVRSATHLPMLALAVLFAGYIYFKLS